MRRLTLLLMVVSFLSVPLIASAERLCVTGFNLESGDSDTGPLTQLVHRHSDCDLWGFSEVQNDDVARDLEKALELARNSDFERIMGTTGGADKLAIIYDSTRLETVGQTIELNKLCWGSCWGSGLWILDFCWGSGLWIPDFCLNLVQCRTQPSILTPGDLPNHIAYRTIMQPHLLPYLH